MIVDVMARLLKAHYFTYTENECLQVLIEIEIKISMNFNRRKQ